MVAMGTGLKAMIARGAPTAPCICIRTSQNAVNEKFAQLLPRAPVSKEEGRAEDVFSAL